MSKHVYTFAKLASKEGVRADEVVEKIHEVYGSNLQDFFRDQSSAAKLRLEKTENRAGGRKAART
jgi:hypothetical protein